MSTQWNPSSSFWLLMVGASAMITATACSRPAVQPATEPIEASTSPAEEHPPPQPVIDTSPDDAATPTPQLDASPPQPEVETPEPLTPAELHQRSIVIDTHNDLTLRLIDDEEYDFGARMADGHADLVRMRQGGLDAQFLAVWVNPREYPGEKAWGRAMAMFDAIEAAASEQAGKARLVRRASEVRQTVSQGKIALLIGVEGAHALGRVRSEEQALARLTKLHDRGASYMTLTWLTSNALGGASGDRGRTKGLTELGHQAVRLMNDLGMIVDVSHVSDPTFFDAVKASRSPVLASHSGVRALHEHHRNLTDDMLRAIAKNGGAACIVFYPGYLDGRWAAAYRRARRTGASMDGVEPVPLSKLIDHIDHAVEVAGVDHVCLGSDFDGIGATPVGLEDISQLPNITAELVRRGYEPEDVEKILGGNVLRVLEANERGAR